MYAVTGGGALDPVTLGVRVKAAVCGCKISRKLNCVSCQVREQKEAREKPWGQLRN